MMPAKSKTPKPALQAPIPQALSIAGSDSGGGAGVQADLKTMQMRGVFGCSVITAVTAQNTQGVFAIHQIPPEMIYQQMQVLADDFAISAVKIGMLGDVATIAMVAQGLQDFDFGTVVLDPVMIAKGGASLLQADAVGALISELLPRADIITPNLPEAEALTRLPIATDDDIMQAGRQLQAMMGAEHHSAKAVIIKGGHALADQSRVCCDWVFCGADVWQLTAPRFETRHTHGTGCTFSACLTAELARGKSLRQAIQTAKDYITGAISQPLNIGRGQGPVNHWAYQSGSPSQ